MQRQVVGELISERYELEELVGTGGMSSVYRAYDKLLELYFQNPEFGFYFLRLTSERLFSNMEKMEEEIVRLRAALPEVKSIQQAASA